MDCVKAHSIVALAGSRHVTYLMENNLINYSQSPLLQKIYDIKDIPSELIKPIKDSLADTTDVAERTKAFTRAIEAEKPASAGSKSDDPEALLVTKDTGQLVSLCFGLPQVDVELGRAFDQVNKQVNTEQVTTIDQGQTSTEIKEDKK